MHRPIQSCERCLMMSRCSVSGQMYGSTSEARARSLANCGQKCTVHCTGIVLRRVTIHALHHRCACSLLGAQLCSFLFTQRSNSKHRVGQAPCPPTCPDLPPSPPQRKHLPWLLITTLSADKSALLRIVRMASTSRPFLSSPQVQRPCHTPSATAAPSTWSSCSLGGSKKTVPLMATQPTNASSRSAAARICAAALRGGATP